MITVVNRETAVAAAPMYEGFTLSEACDQMILSVNETVNDLMMDILLTEHAYLYENAQEIEYVTEGVITEAGINLKEKVGGAVKKAIDWISGLWEKFVEWLESKVADIKNFLAKASISKSTFEKSKEYLKTLPGDVKIKVSPWIFDDKIMDVIRDKSAYLDSSNYKSGKAYAPNEYFQTYAVEEKEQQRIDAKENGELNSAIDVAEEIIFNTKSPIADIRRQKKKAIDSLKSLTKGIDTIDPDAGELSDKVNSINQAIKSDANVCKDKIRLYQKVIASNLVLAKDIVKIYRSHQVDDAKKKVAEKANDVKSGAESIGTQAKNSADAAGEAMKVASHEVGNAVKGAAQGVNNTAKKLFGKKYKI